MLAWKFGRQGDEELEGGEGQGEQPGGASRWRV